jgi:hypothetical protein
MTNPKFNQRWSRNFVSAAPYMVGAGCHGKSAVLIIAI